MDEFANLEKLLVKKKPICCEKCGCSIRSGRICERCASGSSSDARAIFRADVGDRPKSISNDAQDRNRGQMHFIGRKR